MDRIDTYDVIDRWFDRGWKSETHTFTGTFQQVGAFASKLAHVRDAQQGGDTYWTVSCFSTIDGKRLGMFELFHGRLS